MWACNTVAFAVPTIAVDPLDCIVSLTVSPWMTRRNTAINRHHRKLLLLLYCLPSWLSWRKEVIRLRIWLSSVRDKVWSQHSTRKVLRYFDLNIAEIAFSSSALALLFIWVVRLWSPWWTSLQPAIPVMGYERFSLVTLGRSMGVDIVDMGKICFEPALYSQYVVAMPRRRTYSSSLRVIISSTLNSF